VFTRGRKRALAGRSDLALYLPASRRVHRLRLHGSVAHYEEHGDDADQSDERSRGYLDQTHHRGRLSVIGPRSVHV
jgi:hypothetical protein